MLFVHRILLLEFEFAEDSTKSQSQATPIPKVDKALDLLLSAWWGSRTLSLAPAVLAKQTVKELRQPNRSTGPLVRLNAAASETLCQPQGGTDCFPA